jgi:hypothetical protein
VENKRVAGASKKHKDSNKLLSSFGCKEELWKAQFEEVEVELPLLPAEKALKGQPYY